MTGTTPYRAEYVEALALLARASAVVREKERSVPVLAGDAVVEFDTGSQIVPGDFDFVSGNDEAFARALIGLGFEQAMAGRGGGRRLLIASLPWALNPCPGLTLTDEAIGAACGWYRLLGWRSAWRLRRT